MNIDLREAFAIEAEARRIESRRVREELLPEIERLVWDEVPSEAPSLMEKVTTAFDRVCPEGVGP